EFFQITRTTMQKKKLKRWLRDRDRECVGHIPSPILFTHVKKMGVAVGLI
ncbi:hypothetical protein ACJX0J_007899, partial [Zea mays]